MSDGHFHLAAKYKAVAADLSLLVMQNKTALNGAVLLG
jgi:hypothetical protein